MSMHCPPVAPAAAVLLAVCLCSCRSALDPEAGRVHPDVMTTLQASGEVAVMVALVDPSVGGAPLTGDSAVAEIERMQDDVLAAAVPAGFRLRVRYRSVPALAGTVLTTAGLRALATHRYVQRVDPDPGGTGTR